jgi:hypothetical protein
MRAGYLSLDFWKVGTLMKVFSSISTHVFSSLKRGEDGKFKDSELASIIKNGYATLPGLFVLVFG